MRATLRAGSRRLLVGRRVQDRDHSSATLRRNGPPLGIIQKTSKGALLRPPRTPHPFASGTEVRNPVDRSATTKANRLEKLPVDVRLEALRERLAGSTTTRARLVEDM